jgi:hypothetical protein
MSSKQERLSARFFGPTGCKKRILMRNEDAELTSNTPKAVIGDASSLAPNPRRVAAGKRNRALRKGLTEDGRRRLQEAARRNQPWQYSTGPKTSAGKARAAQNAKNLQLGPLSVREIKRDLADLPGLLCNMRANRQMVDAIHSE